MANEETLYTLPGRVLFNYQNKTWPCDSRVLESFSSVTQYLRKIDDRILDGETPRSLFFRGPGGEIRGISSQRDLEHSWKLFVFDNQYELSLIIDEKIFLNKTDSTQSQ